MFRYYMTSETRQALIDESKRLIASRRQAAIAARARREQSGDKSAPDEQSSDAETRDEMSSVASDSTFARLVADLQWGHTAGVRLSR